MRFFHVTLDKTFTFFRVALVAKHTLFMVLILAEFNKTLKVTATALKTTSESVPFQIGRIWN